MIQMQLTHEKCATRERRIPELEAELTLLTEEATSLQNYIKLLEEKVVRVTNLEHQVELVEHRLTQAQQRIKVNFLIILPQNCCGIFIGHL
jgi:predicted  nucleic acid-binding Zn-ribbon protein